MTPLILINPVHKGDKGLVAHEQQHVMQWLICFALCLPLWMWLGWLALLPAIILHDALYTFARPYRQWVEVLAFKAQLKHGGRIEDAARILSTGYDLKITYTKAMELLK